MQMCKTAGFFANFKHQTQTKASYVYRDAAPPASIFFLIVKNLRFTTKLFYMECFKNFKKAN
jgi:hypothetical protein